MAKNSPRPEMITVKKLVLFTLSRLCYFQALKIVEQAVLPTAFVFLLCNKKGGNV
jgi:hypothetical protein